MMDIPVTAIRSAAKRSDVVAAMRLFYQMLDQRVAAYKPTCWNRALCCRFGSYGHRLFVTTLEVAYYLALGTEQSPGSEDHCPHAVDGKCCVRERRPMGCRIFFCDPNAQTWQGPLTEALLKELRDLHKTLNVPYVYADWMVVLKSLADQPAQDQGLRNDTSHSVIE